jgi:hypothetical protein
VGDADGELVGDCVGDVVLEGDWVGDCVGEEVLDGE